MMNSWFSAIEEPVKGKVNKGLLKELSGLFHAKVEIVSGFCLQAEDAADNGYREK